MKPVVLTFVAHYLPGYRAGGPIRTIANLVERLGDEFEFRIVTLDRDIGDDHPYAGIQTDIWVPCGKALVRYVSADEFGLRKVAEIARSTSHDIIYLNSFFDAQFTIQVLIISRFGLLGKRPIVIAPRDNFQRGLSNLSRLKRRLS